MGTSAILFAIAALGGAAMAAMRLGGRPLPPLALAAVHGIVAAAGLVLLIIAVKGGTAGLAGIALAGFVIAALGGAMMFFPYHLKNRPLPVPLMLVHASVAVISFILLLIQVFRR